MDRNKCSDFFVPLVPQRIHLPAVSRFHVSPNETHLPGVHLSTRLSVRYSLHSPIFNSSQIYMKLISGLYDIYEISNVLDEFENQFWSINFELCPLKTFITWKLALLNVQFLSDCYEIYILGVQKSVLNNYFSKSYAPWKYWLDIRKILLLVLL